MKGGKRGVKRGAAFHNIGSDQIYLGMKVWREFSRWNLNFLTESLWHLKYSYLPPFAPPFSKLLFLKKVEPHILPESKINFIRALVPKIRYVKVKNVIFYLKLTKREAKFDPRSVRKSLFFYTLNSNWNKSIFSSRNAINLIFDAKCFSDNNF